MFESLDVSYVATLLLSFPAAGFLVRIFVIQHDCSHGSFFPSRKWNTTIGSVLGVLTLTPFHYWRRTHAIHHSTSGDLDRRDVGDITTLTTREYLMMPAASRLLYRLYRHPLVLFGMGPLFQFVLKHRLPWDLPLSWWREWLSVGGTNIALLGILVAAATTMGLSAFLMVQMPICIVAFTAAIWLFFVQHQFEATYWRPHHDWDFCEAGLLGSSYYDLPPLLHWFSGNIGFHHVHHLAARIPNYRLQQCVRDNPSLPCLSRISMRQSLGFVRLALWDEDQQKLIGFSDLNHRAPAVGTGGIDPCDQNARRQ